MTFDERERRVLDGLADVLIPAGRNPSASRAGVSGDWLDAVLAARPDLAAKLKELLGKSAGREPANCVADLRQHDRAMLNVLTEVIGGAYFMNPAVRDAIGYKGQPPRHLGSPANNFENDLLTPVIRRGPIYRPTPNK